jgi:ATP-dependent RNA helicase RhlE
LFHLSYFPYFCRLNKEVLNFNELNLNKALLSALEDLDFQEATPIQFRCFNPIMSGRDVVGVAQTGTGKTFAYLLPALRWLPYSDTRNPRILILVPTRELVLQIEEEVRKLTQYMSVRIAGAYGGTNINTQKETVYEGLDVLVATPGRLIDLALSGVLKLKDVKKLIIDEVDEIFNLGFRHQLITIFDILPEKRQNLLFSATMPEKVLELIQEYFNDPEIIEVSPTGTPLDQIQQLAYFVPNFYTKALLLEKLIIDEIEMPKVLIFISTKRLADLLFENLNPQLQKTTGVIHSNKSQNYRINAVRAFESGENRILIATDIVSRGLDFKDISHVINFDFPEEPRDYMHRTGRTGRADREGVAITFVTDNDIETLEATQDLMKMELTMLPIPSDIVISDKWLDDEKPKAYDKNYLPKISLKASGGAFHQRIAKNQKDPTASKKRKRLELKIRKQKAKRKKKK